MTPRGTSERDMDRIAAALLYEGYMLYPYRPSSVKNRQRFNFGIVNPAAMTPATCRPSACCAGVPSTELTITARFLHLIDRHTVATRGRKPLSVP